MDIFHALTMLGGLCLFLFGMNFMGQALERRAGGKLRTLLDKMTSRVFVGFLTGLGVTAVIQSSSATTVMVVGFVNSGLLSLRQAIAKRAQEETSSEAQTQKVTVYDVSAPRVPVTR